MNTELERRKQEITRSQGRRKLWQRIVSALAAVVMFVTTYVLILPVEAQNRTFCEMEAHEHSAENGCYVETKTLKCEQKHEHTDECYITLLTLICQHEEHVHNKECYADKTADVETQADWEASIKAAKLTGEWAKDIIAIANTQLGYRESERNYILGENNEIKGYTRYGDWIGDKYVDWSAAFVAFCVNYTGISKDEMTYDKVPEQWAELMKSAKLFNENITETNPGDIVFIDENGDNKADRVGIVVENTKGKIKTVEGDINNAVAYFEYRLSGDASVAARTDQTNVDSSNEESNSKDFAEAKSTLGRSGREASQTPYIIGSVSLPENPNYNPPIAITDPENTTSPDDRIKETPSPENRVNPTVAPTTPPEGGSRESSRAPREYIAPEAPVLTGINSTTKVAIIYQHPSTGRRVQQYTTLADALDGVDQAVAMGASEATVVFTANYTMTAADHTAMFADKKGASASKIYFTSCYNNGTAEVTSSFAAGNYFRANTETDIYNLTFSGGANIQGGGNKLTIGTGVVGNTSSNIWGGLMNADLDSDTDLSVFSGTWNWIGGGCYYNNCNLNGNSTVYIGGTTVTSYASGGGNTSAQTGNTSLTIGGSANSTYALGGSYNHNIYGNTSLLVTDDAVVTQAYGGSWNESAGRIFDGEISLTLNGNAKATYAFLTSYGYGCSDCGPLTLTINENAQVENACSGNSTTMVGTCGPIIYNIDGSDGAYVKNIFGCAWSSGAIAAGTELDITVKNMKSIRHIDASTRNSGSGKITIEGDCGVQYYFYTNANIDVELAENATLQMGSNPDFTQPGNAGEFRGQMQFLKSLIINTNSKLIMAGDSYGNAYRTIKDIDVRGAGAEIDIYKRGTTAYPIQVSGEKLGSDELKLGVFKVPDEDTADPSFGTVLLTFSVEANAKEENHAPGAVTKGNTYEKDLDGVHKSGANIIVCKLLDDPIDIGIGHVIIGEEYSNGGHHTTQYIGDTATPYAHDHALAASYTFIGENTLANANYPKIWVKRDATVQIVFDGIHLATPRAGSSWRYDKTAVQLSGTNTTIVLKDGTDNRIVVFEGDPPCVYNNRGNNELGGCIAKNGMDGSLTIQCENVNNPSHRCTDSCGALLCDASASSHAPGIGSQLTPISGAWCAGGYIDHVIGFDETGTYSLGFSNLNIMGGRIVVNAASHTPAIGVICGCAHFTADGRVCDRENNDYAISYAGSTMSQNNNGHYCKDITITGGRVYAYGKECSAGIGTGWATQVEGIHISNGAYVYAEGGANSPGIGSGGNWRSAPNVPFTHENFKLKNFVVTGGDTVVEALGGTSNLTNADFQFTPGIGVGLSDYYNTSDPSRFTDSYADPDPGYVAIIKQGTPDTISFNLAAARAASEFVPGAPSTERLAPHVSKFYTLIYFAKIEKTASVNNGAEANGAADAHIEVQEGDTVKYIIRTGEIADSNGAVTGSLVDVLPEGMTFSGSGASPAAGFSYSYDDSSKRYTVRWDNISFNEAHEFSVNVTVNNLPAGVNEKTFENQAVLVHSDGTNEIPLNSNWTYHKVVRQAPPEFDLTIEKTVVGAGTGPFSFTVTFTDGTGAAVNIPQPAAGAGYTVTNNVASFEISKDESVTITGIPVDTVATIVETSHNGYTVQYNFSDGTPSVSGDTAEVTIADDLTVTCINNAGFELPHTGGTGSLILTLGGVILVATALMYGISSKRRQWRAWI